MRAFVLLGLLGIPVLASTSFSGAPDPKITAFVDGRAIPLGATEDQRLPYGRPIRLVVETANPATAVLIRAEVEGGSTGSETTTVTATQVETEGTKWAALLPAVHLNESGRYTIRVLGRAVPKKGTTQEQVVAAFLRALTNVPSGLDPDRFREANLRATREVARDNYDVPPELLIVQQRDGSMLSADEAIAQAVVEDLSIANVVDNIQYHARHLVSAVEKLREAAPDRALDRCKVAKNWEDLLREARELASSQDRVLERIAAGDVPWDACAYDLVAGFSPDQRFVGSQAKAIRNIDYLLGKPDSTGRSAGGRELLALHALTRSIQAVTETVVSIKTLDVPILADELERFTQVDIMTAFLPHKDLGLVQPFAAVTWYFSGKEPEGENYAARAEPRDLSDRLGLQIGYPVGGPITESFTPFEPELLLGVIYRVNAFFSFSGGVVTGRTETKRDEAFFLSTNLDISNLGPLRAMLARPDH